MSGTTTGTSANLELTSENVLEKVDIMEREICGNGRMYKRYVEHGFVMKDPSVLQEDASEEEKAIARRWNATSLENRPLTGPSIRKMMAWKKRGKALMGNMDYGEEEVLMELDEMDRKVTEIFAKHLSGTQLKALQDEHTDVWDQWRFLPRLVIPNARNAIMRLTSQWVLNKFRFSDGHSMAVYMDKEERFFKMNNLLAKTGALGDAETMTKAMKSSVSKLPDTIAKERERLLDNVDQADIRNYTQLKRELLEIEMAHKEQLGAHIKELQALGFSPAVERSRERQDIPQPAENNVALTTLTQQVSALTAMVTQLSSPGECHQFNSTGSCRFGDSCRFAHGQRGGRGGAGRGRGRGRGGMRGGGRGGSNNQGQRICFGFRDTGECRFGDACHFSHGAQGSDDGN